MAVVKKLIIIIFLLLVSCKTNQKVNLSQKAKAFVFLKKSVKVQTTEASMVAVHSTASGACIRAKNFKKYRTILTAAHFCNSHIDKKNDTLTKFISMNDEKNPIFSTIINAVLYSGQYARTKIIKINNEDDLCILELDDFVCQDELIIANDLPKKQSMIYNFAAPLSIFQPGTIVTQSGYYSGDDFDGDMIFTVPSIFGSSGSPIVNEKLQLISIIKITMAEFNHISVGTNLVSIKEMLSNK